MKAILTTGLLFGLLSAFATAAPIGYVLDGDSSIAHRVDLANGAATSFSTFSLAYPIAIVDNSLRVGQRDAGNGYEYGLNGTLLSGPYAGGGGFSQLLDGTTNGINNFGVECCGGTNSVTTGDLYWQGQTVLFNLPQSGSGIAYDSALGTLWVALFDGTVHQYTMGGVDLGSFNSGFTSRGLAYDAGSDTLWGLSGSTFTQWDKQGNVLGTVASQVEFSNPWGLEIDNGVTSTAAIPEPGTVLLLGSALALLGLARKSRAI
ncbi:MAG: hypothetical protein C0504_18930 [Candidatus Solibacter sp.]|nr:hypothetical protein [Candidatus Solibacter sp.]